MAHYWRWYYLVVRCRRNSPLGYDPNFFFKVFENLLKSNKVILCDIAELNPAFDQDNCTAKLATRIVDFAAGVL